MDPNEIGVISVEDLGGVEPMSDCNGADCAFGCSVGCLAGCAVGGGTTLALGALVGTMSGSGTAIAMGS